MRILFLSYWGISDPLTVSTVFPHLQLLQQMPQIEKIVLTTIERGADAGLNHIFAPEFATDKIAFCPLRSKQNQPLLLNKLDDFRRFPRELAALVQEYVVGVIVARSALAGALAYLVWKKMAIPFLVESFEPHADYMLESGVWKRYDPRFLFERFWEGKQKQFATGLMPVAENYRRQLISEGVPSARIATVPCSVNMEAFRFNEMARQRTRQRLNLPTDAIVGIYVGKFGGMYYEREAFALFRAAADFFGANFWLILLTPTPAPEVQAYLQEVGFRPEQVFVTKALPAEVPAYLAAADFAFATYKKGPAKQFLSPIKVGEYWATGLPVLLTEGVGDDSDIIQREGGGAVFDLSYPETVLAALIQLATIFQQPGHRADISALAHRYRTVERARAAYEQFLLPLIEKH